ncbi:hypothetical protein DND58_20920 [Pseudomonas syringae pv. pisi]|nr:hypothetical protein N032_22775 [Pseudomonas syringae pv. pisi str. PP1]PYD09986.1 hypothetical protein DND62_20815 [Pseudomonas syringae pv. pisi]PYD29396.1 hypothetical protein DND58_20920 [Pseudomonas syringae pv. pisi]PYD36075.1 hypothetical protein DND67_01020 [Pseudomonas syringae pv. pisi]
MQGCDMHELLKVAIESAVLLFVPGPTNTLLLAAGVSKGFLKSAGLPLFELSGYVIAITFYSILIEYVSGNTVCLFFMKVFCAGYISYMSCKTWKLSGDFLNATETILGFNVFITTLFNPKAFIVSSIIFSVTLIDDPLLIAQEMLVFSGVMLLASLFWLSVGTFVNLHSQEGGGTRQVILKASASVLMMFSCAILYSGVSSLLS